MSALRDIIIPNSETKLVDSGRIKDIEFEDNEVIITLNMDDITRDNRHALEDTVLQATEGLDGIEDVSIEVEMEAQDVPTAPDPGVSVHKPGAPAAAVKQKVTPLSKIKNLIGIASGKGGVGKSTVSVNLAMALKAKGARVGICDIDIYGPSIPIQMGVAQAKPGVSSDQKRFQPVEAYGVKIMSIGFLVDDDTPVIWRGPIVSSVVKQFLDDVDWGELDYLVIDMPPGTGDAQLTLTQSAPLTGAVIVTTPSELALVDAQKGLQMFRKVEVPVLGLIENMSYYVCGHCGEESQPFNKGRTNRLTEQFDVPLLARIPLDHDIQRGSDEGRPVVAMQPDSPQALAFSKLADGIIEKCPYEEKKNGLIKGLFGR
ncbi:MAG: Mrp/NBP35 family ATP-binding protein [Myxococcota bacterium]|nr:Mrp/NBP35 family ATP-binding protein [Myxococcota bacterium]